MNNYRALNSVSSAGISTIAPRPKAVTSSTTSFLSSLKAVAQKQASSATTVSDAPTIYTTTVTDCPTWSSTLRADKKLNVPNLIQGQNECGPTALAMIMKYNGIDPGNYHNMFYSDTVGHGPEALKEKAAAKNMLVRQENNGSLADLAKLIDQGIPPLVLGICGGGSNSSLSDYIDNASRGHWMTVTGYKRNDAGTITHIYFNDPNRSTTQCWTASDFLNKFWNNNIIPGGHRYYMAMAKRGTYQETALKTVLPFDQITSNFSNILHIIDGLEDAFYKAEKIADDIGDWFGGIFS